MIERLHIPSPEADRRYYPSEREVANKLNDVIDELNKLGGYCKELSGYCKESAKDDINQAIDDYKKKLVDKLRNAQTELALDSGDNIPGLSRAIKLVEETE